MKKIKSTIKRWLISYCINKAIKHNKKVEFLRNMEGFDYIWALGSHVIYRDSWLKLIIKIQNL